MPVQVDMKGPRLEFVVVPLKGKKTKLVYSFDEKQRKNVPTVHTNDKETYLVYCPSGQVHHLTGEQLVKRKFDRQPEVLNFDKIKDTTTPEGQFKFGIDEATRKRGWKAMEAKLIKYCEARTGPIKAGEQTTEILADVASAA